MLQGNQPLGSGRDGKARMAVNAAVALQPAIHSPNGQTEAASSEGWAGVDGYRRHTKTIVHPSAPSAEQCPWAKAANDDVSCPHTTAGLVTAAFLPCHFLCTFYVTWLTALTVIVCTFRNTLCSFIDHAIARSVAWSI